MVNIFDTLLQSDTSQPNSAGNELDRYLATGTEQVDNALHWWTERRTLYPHLSRMALDYLSIPGAQNMYFSSCNPLTLCTATSVDVERVFSRGRFTLPYVRNRLSAQSTRAQLCVGNWSLRGHIHDSDVLAVSRLPDVEGDVGVEFEEGWDKIIL